MKKCPYCAEYIQDEAVYCRFCGHDLPASLESPPTSLLSQSSSSGYRPTLVSPHGTATSEHPDSSYSWFWISVATISALILTGIGLYGLTVFYGFEVAICGLFVFPAVFLFYPFIYWYHTGTFPFAYFLIWGLSLFAASKVNRKSK